MAVWWTPTADDTYPFKYLAGVSVALKLVLALGGPDREDALFAVLHSWRPSAPSPTSCGWRGKTARRQFCGLEALNHIDGFCGHPRPLKEAGLLGQAHHLHPIGFVLSPGSTPLAVWGCGGSGRGPAGDHPARAEELPMAAMRSKRGAAGGGAVHLRRRHRPDRAPPAGGLEAPWCFPVRNGIRAWWASVAPASVKKYAAPSFMIHLKDGSGKGSCRSYGGFNLFSCAGILL